MLASHSNCRRLCRHRRNLTDPQLAALGRRGAVIGVNQVRFLCRRDGSAGTVEDVIAHLRHTEAAAGPGSACLGLDFARDYTEAVPKPRAFWDDWDPAAEDILPGWEALPELGRRLADAGLPPDRVEGILGGNLLRFLQKHLPAEE